MYKFAFQSSCLELMLKIPKAFMKRLFFMVCEMSTLISLVQQFEDYKLLLIK